MWLQVTDQRGVLVSIADRIYTSQHHTNQSNARRQLMALFWCQNQGTAPLPLREFVATDL